MDTHNNTLDLDGALDWLKRVAGIYGTVNSGPLHLLTVFCGLCAVAEGVRHARKAWRARNYGPDLHD